MLVISNQVVAQPIKVGIVDLAPFYYLDNKTNQFKGATKELLDEIFQDVGLEPRLELFPVLRLYDELASNSTDFFVGLKGVKTYDESVIYSSKWILKVAITVYSFNPDIKMPVKKEELNGNTIITIHGYTYFGLKNYLERPESKMTVFSTLDHISGFRMLQGERATFLLDYNGPMSETLKTIPVAEKQGLRQQDILVVPAYFILSKTYPDAAGVMLKLEKSYDKLLQTGKYSDFPAELNFQKTPFKSN